MIQIQSSDDDPDRVMIQIQSNDDDPDREMIQIQWWCPMMIQIERWSRSSDDVPDRVRSSDDVPDQVWSSDDVPDRVWSSDDDPDREMIQIERWSRSRWIWLEDKYDEKRMMTWRLRILKMQMMRWCSWYREEDQCWKLCRNNTFLVKRECWCICNFGMYSSMYLMYCNLMFIPRCIYHVFESCCLASMFRSGGSIM